MLAILWSVVINSSSCPRMWTHVQSVGLKTLIFKQMISKKLHDDQHAKQQICHDQL